MKYLPLSLILLAYNAQAQSNEIDFHVGIFRSYEKFANFYNQKGYDSIEVVSSSGKRDIVVRYESKKITEIEYFDTLSRKSVAWKSYKYSGDVLQEIEQEACYGYEDATRQIKVQCGEIRATFKKIFEYDTLHRLKTEKHFHFNYFRNQPIIDSVFADYAYTQDGFEVHQREPFTRTTKFNFDVKSRPKSRIEYNRENQKMNEWFFDHRGSKLIVTLNIYRDGLDDEVVGTQSFTYVISYNKAGVATKFHDGKRKYYFKYY